MPAPRVFISSTCYDLKYIRENLKFFIRSLGYEPVLSEEGSVTYSPDLHVQDACLAEVPACQIFILIMGGRYGSSYKDTEKSITNREYQEAVKAKIPIFALVEREVNEEYRVYLSNKENQDISYPAADSTKIFDFIEEVQGQAINNALFSFSDFEEMQNYLRSQWAGLMYRFLTSESEARRVGDILSSLTRSAENIEFLTRQVADSVINEPIPEIAIELYDILSRNNYLRPLYNSRLNPSPERILKYPDLDSFFKNSNVTIQIDENATSAWSRVLFLDTNSIPNKSKEDYYSMSKITFSKDFFDSLEDEYLMIRKKFLKHLKSRGISEEDFISYFEKKVTG